MALKKATTHRGLEVPEGYHRIGAIRFDAPNRLFLKVDTFATAEAAASGDKPLTFESVNTTLDQSGITKASLNIKKAYEYLKTREEYEEAEDV